MKIGIIREEKIPHEDRAPFTPRQCQQLMSDSDAFQISIQPYDHRCYTDDEYLSVGVDVTEDISDKDVLFGVKEVPVERLITGKTYCIFSHTIKKQLHNRKLLQEILHKDITLIDYEMMTDDSGRRLVAFGTYAGVCGAHNSIWAYGQRTGQFTLPRLNEFDHYEEVKSIYKNIHFPEMKVVITGTGRVGHGAADVLRDMQILEVTPEDFLTKRFEDLAVFTILSSRHYLLPLDNAKTFDSTHFRAHPEAYRSNFKQYLEVADIFINGIYWDTKAPRFFELQDISSPDFKVSVIGDITCDIAPEASIPTTIRPSSIDAPVYGISRKTLTECVPFSPDSVDIMAVDNVANELSRDASHFFGEQLIQNILPEFLHMETSDILKRATIARNGSLTPAFEYLSDYVDGVE